jgi:hypothetical protein
MTTLQYVANLIVIAAVGLLVLWLRSYVVEKGKSLATKEDARAIAKEVEAVKSEYAQILEALKQRHDLRLVAVERRLQTHQEAYERWFTMLRGLTDLSALRESTSEQFTWLSKNRLYLEPQVVDAFDRAVTAARDRVTILQADTKALKTNFADIRSLGQVIVDAVKLPLLAIDKDPPAGPEGAP